MCTICIIDVHGVHLLITTGWLYIRVINRRGTEMTIRQRLAQFAQYQRTMRELSNLDTRQLNDLGITRADFKAIASGKLSQ